MRVEGGIGMLGALITIPRENEDHFSVIMPVADEEYDTVRRLRTLGDLRKWLETHADNDSAAAAILLSLQQEVSQLSNRHPLDIRMEIPGQSGE